MNGADTLVKTLEDAGLDMCFANPGTSEMHLVGALDRSEKIRTVLVMFEGVASGAADGYARMTRKPAATLLHLGPGLGNALANLHNARRANSPVLNIVGDHATWHSPLDTPLTSDVAAVAKAGSKWVKTSSSAANIASETAEAYAASLEGTPGVVTLIVPANHAWEDATNSATVARPNGRPAPDAAKVTAAAEACRSDRQVALLLDSTTLYGETLEVAGRIAEATGVRIIAETFPARLERGDGAVKLERLPYFGEMIEDMLKSVDQLVLVGTKTPTSFFAYQNQDSVKVPKTCTVLSLATEDGDPVAALEALADALQATAPSTKRCARQTLPVPPGKITLPGIGASLVNHMPENALVSEEACTSSAVVSAMTEMAARHEWMTITGGSIGQGLPVSVGAALACPDRKVICLHGDGGAMYTVQSLWTQARENLDITTVIFSNRTYAILGIELMRTGQAETAGDKAKSMLSIGNPDLDWVKIAEGMGVSATVATTNEAFDEQFKRAMETPGPHLIEACIESIV